MWGRLRGEPVHKLRCYNLGARYRSTPGRPERAPRQRDVYYSNATDRARDRTVSAVLPSVLPVLSVLCCPACPACCPVGPPAQKRPLRLRKAAPGSGRSPGSPSDARRTQPPPEMGLCITLRPRREALVALVPRRGQVTGCGGASGRTFLTHYHIHSLTGRPKTECRVPRSAYK